MEGTINKKGETHIFLNAEDLSKLRTGSFVEGHILETDGKNKTHTASVEIMDEKEGAPYAGRPKRSDGESITTRVVEVDLLPGAVLRIENGQVVKTKAGLMAARIAFISKAPEIK